MTLGSKMARGAVWMVAWRLADRVLGLLSTLVLVRLLLPSDFGLVSMATSLIALIGLLSAFSFDVALIQNQRAERRHYDTAWTLNVLFGFATAIVLALLAGTAARFYAEPRLEAVLYSLAVGSALAGLSNIGTVAFRKDIELGKEFAFQMAKRIVMVVVTITLALTLRSYWALVIANILANGLGVLISFGMHPYRPRFSLAAGSELLHFSKWLLINNSLNFLQNGSPNFILGKIVGTQGLGIYNVAYEIANLPTSDLVAPITRATYPGYAKMAGDLPQLRSMYLRVTALIAFITIPIGVAIVALSELVVALLLGPNWSAAAPLMSCLAIYGVTQCLQANGGAVMVALGRLKAISVILAIHCAALVPALIYGAYQGGALGGAIATLAVGVILTPVNLAQVFARIELGFGTFMVTVWRPLAAAAVLFVLLRWLVSALPATDLGSRLTLAAASAGAGTAVYLGAVWLLWMASGRPEGPESILIGQAKGWLGSGSERLRA